MDRTALYHELVAKRKAHVFPQGLMNPSQIQGGIYDDLHLGPWSRWQGCLDAEVVVVGQDWGDERYFCSNGGRDSDSEQTCMNLRKLALAAGWDIGSPLEPLPQPLFFTNAVLGIRNGCGKSGTPPNAWVDDSLSFLVDLLRIVQPRIVISLGTSAYRACRLAMLGQNRDPLFPLGARLNQMHKQSPILLEGRPVWFALYHCGPLGLVNRALHLQSEDWRMVRAVQEHRFVSQIQHADLEGVR